MVKVKAAVPEISVDCSYVTKDSITLTMSGDEYVTGYEIQKKSVKNKKTVWTTLAQTASPSYTDSKLKADTTYSYRVRPYFFNTDTNKTVKGAWEYCEAMTGWGGALKLHAKAASKTSVKLDWSKISGAKDTKFTNMLAVQTQQRSSTEKEMLSQNINLLQTFLPVRNLIQIKA